MGLQERPEAALQIFRREALVLFACLALVVVAVALRPAASAGAPGSLRKDLKININEARWQQLLLLDGIGLERARAIAARREEFGPFKSRKDLQSVKGISAALAEKIERRITYR